MIDLALVDGRPLVVWLDTRRAPEDHTSDVYAWFDGREELVYSDSADGVCMCCRPAAGVVDGRPAAAFRDADGPGREVRVVVRDADAWRDTGRATSGGWAPGGCPSDGPRFRDDGSVLVSDARGGTRRIYAGDQVVVAAEGVEVMQPRPIGDRVVHVEATPGRARLMVDDLVLAESAGRLEPGDPVTVADAIWMPWNGDVAHVVAIAVPR